MPDDKRFFKLKPGNNVIRFIAPLEDTIPLFGFPPSRPMLLPHTEDGCNFCDILGPAKLFHIATINKDGRIAHVTLPFKQYWEVLLLGGYFDALERAYAQGAD
jgi:hypothetical protein